MACPYFLPTERADDIAFPHPARLPLGASWRGMCSAPGHEQAVPDAKELESCNLGYANCCHRLPKERLCDAVRFAVMHYSTETISVQFVLETQYLPAGHGTLQFNQALGSWIRAHPDPRIQIKAECFLRSYLQQKNRR